MERRNEADIVVELPWVEPLTKFAMFAERPHCIWLDSATAGDQGRYSILASDPSEVFRFNAGKQSSRDPFQQLAGMLAGKSCQRGQELFPTGAAIGYFGYGLKNCIEDLPARAADDLGLPDCWFGFYDNLMVFDHVERRVWQIGDGGTGVSPVQQSQMDRRDACPTKPVSNFTRETYRAAVLRAKDYIAAGDIYQVNLSQRFQCEVDAPAMQVYRALRESNPAPYGAYLDIGDAQILSSSPECFLKMDDRQVVTRPIKGTRPRHVDPAELLASPKDNAELVMITDLERNDLGRVCDFGSVHVPEMVRVESYATVHHLVSTVAGTLRRDVSHVDAVRACFPGGSITGAPKIRAMEIIDELEPHARGVYTGALGFFGYNGMSHFNIAIRTVVYQPIVEQASSLLGMPATNLNRLEACPTGILTFHAGGGIVADSEPDAEYDETLAKAKGIFNALDQLRLR